jgi:hypothetical protein
MVLPISVTLPWRDYRSLRSTKRKFRELTFLSFETFPLSLLKSVEVAPLQIFARIWVRRKNILRIQLFLTVEFSARLVKQFSESQVTCVDDPIEVRLYICEREPNSPECVLTSSDKDAFDDAEFSIFEIVSAGVSSFIFGTLVSLVVVIAVSRRSQEAAARKENRLAAGSIPSSSSRDTSINSGDRLSDPLLLSESQFIDSDSDTDDD